MTREEMNDVLNRFRGWKPGQRCVSGLFKLEEGRSVCFCGEVLSQLSGAVHNIPFFDYFADTPAAREAVRLLKYEFARRTGRDVTVSSYRFEEMLSEGLDIGVAHAVEIDMVGYTDHKVESIAIATAIAEALKEREK